MREQEILIVRAKSREIPVEVVRGNVKNLNLRVRADGSVRLSIPRHLAIEVAEQFLERRASWIDDRVRQRKDRVASEADGGTDQGRRETPWERAHLWGETLDVDHANSPYDEIERLHAAEIQRALPGIVEKLEHEMGVHASRWSVRFMKTRWGSCTPATGAIRINARLAAYHPDCLEFVVAHELVHLMEPSHSRRFHMLLDTYCPRNREIAKSLRF